MTYINHCVDILKSRVCQEDKKSAVDIHYIVWVSNILAFINQSKQTCNELIEKLKACLKILNMKFDLQ